jgi:uncharacterized membrane protein
MTIEDRLARLEESVAAIAARLERLEVPSPRTAAPSPAGQGQAQGAPSRAPYSRWRDAPSPHAGKSTEWWLARGGALLTCFALILLYQYAVARNWITPVVRVTAGTLVGAALFAAGLRTARRSGDSDTGMREVLLGAGLSSWYITAYAAAIFYSLISVSSARLLFLALTILGAWLALRETRSILAILALGAGFATPLLLPSPTPSIPAFSIYLGALTGIGLILYLMRGWQLVLWLTYIAFWVSTGEATGLACCEAADSIRISGSLLAAQISLAAVIVLAALAFMRAPSLRRGLVNTGSDLYTIPKRSDNAVHFQREMARNFAWLTGRATEDDSPALWTCVIITPLVALTQLSWTLTAAPLWQWGAIALIAAAAAWRAVRSPRDADSETTHIFVAAAAVWSLAGIVTFATSAAPYPLRSESIGLLAACIHALVTLELAGSSRYGVPRRLAFATASACLATVLFSELILSSVSSPAFDGQWVIAELGAVALAIWIWWNRRPYEIPLLAKALGAGAYVALLFIDARVLGRVWQPLVTASYAVAGAAMLIYARGPEGTRTMRRLGGITLIVVVARLLMVDLARVETIWRVLLFLGCGALFLLTSYRLQATEPKQSA